MAYYHPSVRIAVAIVQRLNDSKLEFRTSHTPITSANLLRKSKDDGITGMYQMVSKMTNSLLITFTNVLWHLISVAIDAKTQREVRHHFLKQ